MNVPGVEDVKTSKTLVFPVEEFQPHPASPWRLAQEARGQSTYQRIVLLLTPTPEKVGGETHGY
jgi:hypothetical protein